MEHVLIPTNHRHAPWSWEFANEAARLAQSTTSADLGKIGWQKSDDTFWALRAVGQWKELGSGTVVAPSDPVAKIVSGTAYTIQSTDKKLEFTSNSNITVTVPSGLATSTDIPYLATGNGIPTFVAAGGSGVSITGTAGNLAGGKAGRLVSSVTPNAFFLLNGSSSSGATAPTAPGTPTATAGVGKVTLTWTAPTNNGGAVILGYRLLWSGGQEAMVGNVLTGEINNLPAVAGTARVYAYNSVGYSVASTASNTVTPTASATAPGKPNAPTLTAGDGSVSAAFTAPSNNGGSAILEYGILLSNGFTNTGNPTTSPINVVTPNGTAVTAQVRARNVEGWGPYSDASNSVTPQAAGSARAVITVQPTDQTIEEGTGATWTFQALYAVSYGWDVMNDGVTWTVVGNGTTNTYTSVAQTLSQNGRKWRGWAMGTDGVKVYTDVATQTVISASPQPPMAEPPVQSMLLPATELTKNSGVADNGDGTWTGTSTSSTDYSGYISSLVAAPHLLADMDDYIALEWCGGADVMVCFSSSNTQDAATGSWLHLNASNVKWRLNGTSTNIKTIGPVGTRYRLKRTGTVLTIEEESSSTGAWTIIYTFAAALSNSADLHAVVRTATGKIKPMYGYGIPKSSQSQWIEPGFLNAGGFTFVSAAGETGEIRLAKLVANRYRGGIQDVSVIPPADDHNRAAIIALQSNKMMAGYTGHNEDAFYTNVSNSNYGLDFKAVMPVSVSPSTVSYAQLVRMPSSSRVFRMHRMGTATSGVWNIMWSDDEGSTWLGTQRMHGFAYCWANLAPDNKTLWIHAYMHPLNTTPNNIYLFKIDLVTGDYMHPDGSVVNNLFTGSGTPRIPSGNMLQIVAADGAPASTRMCDVRETGTSRGLAFIRFNKDAVNTSGQLVVGKWDSSSTAYTETVVRAAGKAFASSNAYYPAHCFGADMDTVYCAYESATGIHVIRGYTWNGSSWVAGPIIRQITGIISRPRFHDGYLYWSELKSYVGSPTFSFKGSFVWRSMVAEIPPVVPTNPGVPTDVSGTAGDASASITGTAPSNTGNAPIDLYRATLNPGGIQVSSATLPIPVTGLTNDQAYTATMAVRNTAGLWSAESAASATFTPQAVTAPTEPGVPINARTLTNVISLGDNSYRASGSAAASQNGIIGTGMVIAAGAEGWVQAEHLTEGSSYSFVFGTSSSDTDPQGSSNNYTLQIQADSKVAYRWGGSSSTEVGSLPRASTSRARLGRGTDGVFKIQISTDSGDTWTTLYNFTTTSTAKRYLRIYLTHSTGVVPNAREIIHPRAINLVQE